MGWIEQHDNTEKLSCMLILSRSSVYPQYFFVQCITLLLYQHPRVATHASLLRIPPTSHTCVDYSSHVGKTLATCADLLPYLWPVLYRQQVLDHLIESLPNTFTRTSHLPYTWSLWGSTCTRIQGLSRRTIIHVVYICTSIDPSTIHAWRGGFLTSWWKGVWLHTCNKARTYAYTCTYKNLHLQPLSYTATIQMMITPGVRRQLTHMWQSRVRIKGYSVVYFDRISAFEAPYRWTSIKGGAQS